MDERLFQQNRPKAASHQGQTSAICGHNIAFNPLSYQDDRILAALGPKQTPTEMSEELQQQLLCTKSSGWRYEEEYRRFISLETAHAEGPLHFWPMRGDIQLREVVLGALCDETINSVRQKVERHFPSAVVFKAKLAFLSFKIVPDALTVT